MDATPTNVGLFRIIKVETGANQSSFWIENGSSVETEKQAQIQFIGYNSLVPGDYINIGTSLWSNTGIWKVETVGNGYTNDLTFKVEVLDSINVVLTPGPGALATAAEAAKVTVQCGEAHSYVKQIQSVIPTASGIEIKIKPDTASSRIGEAYGTVISTLDRLDFPESASAGKSGYRYGTGLVGEANRVLYGDKNDVSTYPGVAAADDSIVVDGPRVKRVTVGFSVRLKSGDPETVRSAIQSAVASVVNRSSIGQSIAISDLVTAAASVGGVNAVSVTSPAYSSSVDLIPVSVYEKALVLNLSDVSVVFVGE